MIQKSTKKIQKSRKSNETRDEVEELLKRLVSLETDTKFKTSILAQCHGENDFLGISKFSSPNCLVSNKRHESQKYIDLLMQSEVTQDFSRSDKYFNDASWQFPSENNRSTNTCKCLPEFYNQHSKCSWIVFFIYTNLTALSLSLSSLVFF